MPIYEFDCQDCHSGFEKLVRGFSAIGSVTCPQCGGQQVQKRLSTFASHVAGGSFSLSAPAAACAPGGA
ncbi:MAG: zinc ribbon domain-containing protein [Caldilineales bacterium]|nr:zinc ribbon domain-containing protein [Caldilineales bacterium]